MDRKKKRPANIELDEEKGELAITWKDGRQSRFSLAELRKNCPCATCRELRQQADNSSLTDGLTLLHDEAATATAQAHSFDPVGRYGIRINWSDGHNYGIYTFASLREQDDTDTTV